MSNQKRDQKVSAEGAKSTLRVMVARGVAHSLIGGFDELQERNIPLTQVQKMALTEMALMEYHEAIEEGEKSIEAEVLLSALTHS